MRAFEHRVTHGSITTRARTKYTGAEPPLAAVVLAIAMWPLPSAAHSMREVEAALEAAEPAAQVVDEAAPDLVLEDARGRQVRLDDFRGRVVILDATFAAGTHGCSASAGPMAKVRELLTQVPGLHEQVRFLTVTAPGAAASGDRQHCGQGDPGTNRMFVRHAARSGDGTRTDSAAAFGLDAATAQGAVVLDPHGRIRLRLRGSQFDPLQLMLFAAALAHGEHGATGRSTRAASSFTGTLSWAIGGAFAVFGLAAYAVLESRRRRARSALQEDP